MAVSLMSNQIYHGFDKFKENDELKMEQIRKEFESSFDRLNAEEKVTRKVPEECYRLYGSDLDKCSTQSSEGCGKCILYREQKEGDK